MSYATMALEKVVTPATLTLSKFECPSTSMSVTSILGDPVKLLARDAVPVSAPINEVAVTTPETFACFAKNVVPVTVVIPASVEIPITFKVFVLTLVVEPPPAAAVIVTIPADIGDRDKLAPKSMFVQYQQVCHYL